MTYNEAKKQAFEILKSNDIADYSIDALYLLCEASGHDKLWLLVNGNEDIQKEELKRYYEYINMRALHIPFQHIVGKQEFMGLVFKVNKDVLIPRHETEILTETAGKYAKGARVLDMCTGSGCIAVSIAKLYEPLSVTASDISCEALEIAKYNAILNNAAVNFVQGNLFENIKGEFDLIVSNPPYIPTKVIEKLSLEVKEHDPFIALDGHEDGLHFYREIISRAGDYLSENGIIIFEIGHNQAESVRGLFKKEGYKEICVIKDYSGLDRIVYAIK